MTNRRREWGTGVVLAGAWMVLAYLVMPVFVVVPVSLTPEPYLSWPTGAISGRHYINLFTNEIWVTAMAQSLVTAVGSALLATLLGTLCAIGCWRLASRFSQVIWALMLTPIMVPGVVHAIGFYRLWVDLRLLDTFTGVILAHTIMALPYVLITVTASLAHFDVRLEQAARGLGASMAQTVRRIIIPRIMPGILSGGVFAFVSGWDEVVVLLFLTSRKLRLLPKAIWDSINESFDPTIAAVTVKQVRGTFIDILIQPNQIYLA